MPKNTPLRQRDDYEKRRKYPLQTRSATLTLVSGDKRTVTMGPEVLTDFPQPVVVHIDSLGTPIADGSLRVTVSMNGAPGPNGPYAFTTDANGNASMQLVISNAPGPVLIDVLLSEMRATGHLLRL